MGKQGVKIHKCESQLQSCYNY